MVKVYFAEVSALSDEHIFDQLYKNADLERRIKTDKFCFKKDKMLSIGAWTLLRYASLLCFDDLCCSGFDCVRDSTGNPS